MVVLLCDLIAVFSVKLITTAFLYCCRWLRKPRRIDHLTSASAHLFGLSPGPRAAVALYLLQSALVPVLQTVLALEEDSSKRVEMNGNVREVRDQKETSTCVVMLIEKQYSIVIT